MFIDEATIRVKAGDGGNGVTLVTGTPQQKLLGAATGKDADFSEAGDLKLFTGEETMSLLEQLTAEKGFLDGRYMAATFNLLRGRDLIWSYVVNNYLLGEEPLRRTTGEQRVVRDAALHS